jgi:signal transduction histidine kinase
VVVIKASIEHIEEELGADRGEIVLVADPPGIIFLASRKEWLNHTLQKLSSAQAAKIRQIDKGIQEVREMAVRLRPGVLDRLGLVDALEWYATDFERRTGITCLFEHDGVPAIADNVAAAAYRIAQEALTNVVRHADANLVNVRLQAEEGLLTLTVADNGQGFDPGKPPEEEGLGIAGMKERASLVGGKL